MQLTKKQHENRAKILDEIYTRGPISRIDIANKTGITPATVSSITGELIEEKIIEEVGEDKLGSGSGRKKVLLDVKEAHKFFMGIELSENFIAFCITDNIGSIIDKEVKLLSTQEKSEFLTTGSILQLVQSFRKKYDHLEISGLGIALPGHYSVEERVLLSNNPVWRHIDLDVLKKSIDIPIYFENNVKSMLIYKRLIGSSSADENFCLHHVSRGIFCAYMYNGELFAQNHRRVGEVGHTTVQMDGKLCECGNRGCLQTFSSEEWLIKKAIYIYNSVETTYLKDIVSKTSEIDLQTLLTVYKLGDPLVIDLLQDAIKAIATNIINLSMIIDIRKVYVHGKIYNEPDLLQLLKELVAQRRPLFQTDSNIQLEMIPYRTTNGALGACALAIAETYTKV